MRSRETAKNWLNAARNSTSSENSWSRDSTEPLAIDAGMGWASPGLYETAQNTINAKA